MGTKFCTYVRVSTRKQGATGLGLAAQQKMCDDYVAQRSGTILERFQDIESGTHRDRPGLWAAINFCKENSTPLDQCTLVIAKLDRLARDVEFTFRCLNTGVQIAFVDMPQMNTMILGVFASVAQYERELCSSRTKAALDEIKTDIAENGGHMSKAGRWTKHLGRARGTKIPGVGINAALVRAKKAEDWKEDSALFSFVSLELAHGTRQKDILQKALQLYEKNPKKYCTRKGKPLCWGTLSKWAKELQIGI